MQNILKKFSEGPVLCFVFFALGALLAKISTVFEYVWQFVSPIEWISSLALVMTGDTKTIDAIVGVITFSNQGLATALIAALASGVIGSMLWTTIFFIFDYTSRGTRTGGIAFRCTFSPIWLMLATYKPLLHTSQSFYKYAQALEGLDSQLRLSAGFGIMLLAVVAPMLVFLGSKVLEMILLPERGYRV